MSFVSSEALLLSVIRVLVWLGLCAQTEIRHEKKGIKKIKMFGRGVKLVFGACLVALVGLLISSITSAAPKPSRDFVCGRNNTVLVLSNSENGVSNVHVATSFALAEQYPYLDIHYASFPKLRAEIERVSAQARRRNPHSAGIAWHEIPGLSFTMAVMRKYPGMAAAVIPPGLAGVSRFTRLMQSVLAPWDVDEHYDIFQHVSALIDEIDPAVVVLDSLFGPAMEATRQQNRLHAIVSPNALLDVLGATQPYGAIFWKYPA